jgi:hypothetical protein
MTTARQSRMGPIGPYPKRPSSEAVKPASAPEVFTPEWAVSGNSLVGDPQTLRREWESVQVGFVDDPRRAVDDAERLVARVVEELVDRFRVQRENLEESWSEGSAASINDLRQAFQRYRDFFERLLSI